MALFAIGGDAGTGFLGDFFSEKKSLAQPGETQALRRDTNSDKVLSTYVDYEFLVGQAIPAKPDKSVMQMTGNTLFVAAVFCWHLFRPAGRVTSLSKEVTKKRFPYRSPCGCPKNGSKKWERCGTRPAGSDSPR